MPSAIANCQNFSGCLLAYRHEPIELGPESALLCPECGKALMIARAPRAKRLDSVLGLVAAMTIGCVAMYFFLQPRTGVPPTEATPQPSQTVVNADASAPSAPLPPPEPHEEPVSMQAPAAIDLELNRAETQSIKNEVLTRVDLMPKVSLGNKDKLYASVDRAKQMGKLLTLEFGSGKTSLTGSDLKALKILIDSPEIRKLRENPTAVFIVLGYADAKGDRQKNLAVSQARADSVLSAMREKCGVQNVMHAVAMGSSTMVDAQALEKNRITEIWAVLP